MMSRIVGCAAGLCLLLLPRALSQSSEPERIDMYMADWHNSTPHSEGGLEERDILTRGDPQNPSQRGAALHFINWYRYATLAPGATTEGKKLTGEQQILYVTAGRGTASTAGQTADLFRNIAVLVPADIEFRLRNTGDEPLTMYVIDEPTPPGFRPNPALLVRDENKLPISSSDGHWCHIVKTLFVTNDGLGTLESVLTVALDPLTVGQPHLVDHTDIEEVWSALTGTSLAFIGNQLRRQTPGMAYLHIPDNKTPHTNINYNENEQVTFLYFARYHPHQARP